MKKTIYLHIGTFKTGTSSIQQYLFKHADELEKRGFFVPKGQLVGQHELPLSLIKDYSEFRAPWPTFQGSSEVIWQNFIRQIENTSCSNIIISSESFCDIVNEYCRDISSFIGDKIKDYLSPYNVKVVVYLRSVMSYLRSFYGENIKISPTTIAPEEMLEQFVKNKSIHTYPSIYLDFFSELFGSDSMIVKLYDLNKLKGGDIVADFLDVVGCKQDFAEEEKILIENQSIDFEDINLKRIFNIAGIKDVVFNRQISQTLIQVNNILGEANHQTLYELDYEFEDERNAVMNKYGIDIGLLNSISTEQGSDIGHADGFLIALMATSIRQNRDIQGRLDRIEDVMNNFLKSKH